MTVTFFARYLAWHYGEAPSLLFKLWMNLLWYIGHAFSVSALWRSLFAPWKRIVAAHTKRWDLEDYASAVLANFISRIIGGVMRLFLILMGRALQLTLLICGAVFYICWFALPFLIFVVFAIGFSLVLS